jgi:hypothetical protein
LHRPARVTRKHVGVFAFIVQNADAVFRAIQGAGPFLEPFHDRGVKRIVEEEERVWAGSFSTASPVTTSTFGQLLSRARVASATRSST